MESVRGPEGVALLVGRDGAQARLRDPATGRERRVPIADCDPLDVAPLVLVGRVLRRGGGRGGVEGDGVRDPETDEGIVVNGQVEGGEQVGGDEPVGGDGQVAGDEPAERYERIGSDRRAVGLLAELTDRGPTPARTVVTEYEACESDLQGMLAELRVAGLVTETRVAGLPGYTVTDAGRARIARRRDAV